MHLYKAKVCRILILSLILLTLWIYHKHSDGNYKCFQNKIIHVAGNGLSILERISLYNTVLDETRTEIISTIPVFFGFHMHNSWELVDGQKDDFLDRMADIPTVTTIFLDLLSTNISTVTNTWNLAYVSSDLLIRDYYYWVGSESMCKVLNDIEAHFYSERCTSSIRKSLLGGIIDLPVDNIFHSEKKNVGQFLTYMHIIEHGAVTKSGEVYTSTYKIVPNTCLRDYKQKSLKTFDTFNFEHHEEVFTISQHWGTEFFHKNLENFPRLSPYREFLERNENIKVHVYEKGSYTRQILGMLGIPKSRLVTGNITAKIVYLPRATACGTALPLETQLLSYSLKQKLVKHRPENKVQKTLVILIRRSVKRYFINTDEMEREVKQISHEFGFKFYLFKDNPLPPLKETMEQFNKAAVVVAPHGAGLVNLLYCEPGTFVIETLCNPPTTNLCFLRAAHLLGLHYHGLVGGEGCDRYINITAAEIGQTLKNYLQIQKNMTTV